MTAIRLVLYDIDGTLLSCGRAARRAFEEGLDGLWPGGDAKAALRGIAFAGRTDRGILEAIFAQRGTLFAPEATGPFWPAYLAALENWLALEPPRVHAGAGESGSALRAKGLAVGVLTGNHPEGARIKLRAGDLHDQFAWGAFGHEDRERPPLLPRALAAAEAATGTRFRPGETLLVGDTPLDIACARAHGARVAVVPTGLHPAAELRAASPDFLLDSLAELPGLL